MDQDFREVLVRDPENYPESLKVTLDILTINERPQVVGSAAYLNHKYPSDVDVFEKTTVKLPRDAALKFYADQFQNIMQKVVVDPQIFYLDFKAGEDYRFDVFVPDDNTAESISARKNIVEDFSRKGLLSPNDEIELTDVIDNYEKFREKLRQHRVLRWSPEEVIRGYKNLPADRYITLARALSQPSLTKLDTVTWIQTRFQSVEVFYNLRYLDPETDTVVELYPLGSYKQSLLESIEKYSSPSYYNPLKVAKRLWTLARITNCIDLLRALNPLIGSSAAALNQIDADAEILIEFISKSYTLPKTGYLNAYDYYWSFHTVRNMFMELLGFQKRLLNHLDDESFRKVTGVIDEFFDIWLEWQKSGTLNRGAILLRLQQIRKILKDKILELSQEFIEALDEMNITCPSFLYQEIDAVRVRSPYQ